MKRDDQPDKVGGTGRLITTTFRGIATPDRSRHDEQAEGHQSLENQVIVNERF